MATSFNDSGNNNSNNNHEPQQHSSPASSSLKITFRGVGDFYTAILNKPVEQSTIENLCRHYARTIHQDMEQLQFETGNTFDGPTWRYSLMNVPIPLVLSPDLTSLEIVVSRTEHVSFWIRAEDDLPAAPNSEENDTTTEMIVGVVQKSTMYACLMLRTQRFGSLKRHYAKYHNLTDIADDLVYRFGDLELDSNMTPKQIGLEHQDVIHVTMLTTTTAAATANRQLTQKKEETGTGQGERKRKLDEN